MKSEEFITTN